MKQALERIQVNEGVTLYKLPSGKETAERILSNIVKLYVYSREMLSDKEVCIMFRGAFAPWWMFEVSGITELSFIVLSPILSQKC